MRAVPNVVVIGYGFAGRRFHSYLVGLEPGLNLYGVSSRDPQTRELILAERKCLAFSSYEEVLADDQVDLVVLATPNAQHAPDAIAALGAGKHVVTDKPMCLTLAQCDAVHQAALQSGRVFSVFQNRRWDGDFMTLQNLLSEGQLGDLRWLEMAWVNASKPGGWRGENSPGGGRIYDLGAHLLDQCLLVFTEAVTSVFCRLHRDFGSDQVESHAMITIGFEDGATAIVDTGSMHHTPKPRIQAFGRSGSYVKYGRDPQEEAMKQEKIDTARESPETFGTLVAGKTEKKVATLPGRWRNYYELIACQITNRPCVHQPVRFEETRRVMAVIDAAFESAQTGEVVHTAIPALPGSREGAR
ncbi:MAG: Gfo/Idh/MocA family oxidoreductase [bacterium]|jgi:scyllo-inositol 2-dehydrogenase (NADP+)|nr:Gfo/Idh/MocA family oxidoreductase [bacterium]